MEQSINTLSTNTKHKHLKVALKYIEDEIDEYLENPLYESYLTETMQKKNIDCNLLPLRKIVRTKKASIYIMKAVDTDLANWVQNWRLGKIVKNLLFILKNIQTQIMCVFNKVDEDLFILI